MRGMKGLNRRGKPCAITTGWGMYANHFVMKFTIARLNDGFVNGACRRSDSCNKLEVAFLHCDGACLHALHRNNTALCNSSRAEDGTEVSAG